jgi:hypothetical protein
LFSGRSGTLFGFPMRPLILTPALAAALLLAGCGVPGAPLPPSLDLPQPAGDLQATRKGDKVTLAWTVPSQTSDRALVKRLGATRVCRSPQNAMNECAQPVAELAAAQLQPGKPATFADTLSPDMQRQDPTGFVTYAVETQNTRGRAAGLSNQVRVPLAPVLPPPADLRAAISADGIALTWSAQPGLRPAAGVGHAYRVYRREEGGDKDVIIGEVTFPAEPQSVVVDRNFEWEKRYAYRVTPISRVEQAGEALLIEGEDSGAAAVFAHDVFPPAVPSGVQAVYSGLAQQKFVDLTWAPNTDADLAGYNVYRREPGGMAAKLNAEPVKTPAFRDPAPQPGREYFYSVTAVDLRGNESAKSSEASEKVPQ